MNKKRFDLLAERVSDLHHLVEAHQNHPIDAVSWARFRLSFGACVGVPMAAGSVALVLLGAPVGLLAVGGGFLAAGAAIAGKTGLTHGKHLLEARLQLEPLLALNLTRRLQQITSYVKQSYALSQEEPHHLYRVMMQRQGDAMLEVLEESVTQIQALILDKEAQSPDVARLISREHQALKLLQGVERALTVYAKSFDRRRDFEGPAVTPQPDIRKGNGHDR